jgi:hypothetical protein
MNPGNRTWRRRDWLSSGLAGLTAGFLREPVTGGAEPRPAADIIPVQDPKTLRVTQLPCERIAVGEPDDYKPCVALLPGGELLMTAFHPDIKVGNEVIEQASGWHVSDDSSRGPRLRQELGTLPGATRFGIDAAAPPTVRFAPLC